jgi:hypothetical protein
MLCQALEEVGEVLDKVCAQPYFSSKQHTL